MYSATSSSIASATAALGVARPKSSPAATRRDVDTKSCWERPRSPHKEQSFGFPFLRKPIILIGARFFVPRCWEKDHLSSLIQPSATSSAQGFADVCNSIQVLAAPVSTEDGVPTWREPTGPCALFQREKHGWAKALGSLQPEPLMNLQFLSHKTVVWAGCRSRNPSHLFV